MNPEPVVLYVEDEPRSRKVMKVLLNGRLSLPHVTMFEDSHNFVERLHNLNPPPSIIFLDIHVPPYDGFEMLEMVRESEQFIGIPVIALTASVMNEEVQRLETAGFDGCLAKPINTDTFPDLLQKIINGEHIWQILS